MTAEIFVRTGPGETRYALTLDGVLIRQLVRREVDTALQNTIYSGRIAKIHAGLNAAFVDIGTGQEGYLSAPDAQYFDGAREKPRPIGELFTEGAHTVVQVTREPSAGKGPRLTSRISLTSPNLVLTPFAPGISISKKIDEDAQRKSLKALLEQSVPNDLGIIARTAAADLAPEILQAELEQLLGDWTAAAQTLSGGGSPGILVPPPDPVHILLGYCPGREASLIVSDLKTMYAVSARLKSYSPSIDVSVHSEAGDIFEVHELQEQWSDLYAQTVALPSGGTLHFQETAALTAIDVDSGGGDSNLSGEAFNMSINLEAAQEIGRHLPLREISGQIVIDFLPLRSKDNRSKLEQAFQDALGDASGECRFFGFTRMGLFEMTRRRGRRSFAEDHLQGCPAARRPQSLAYEILYQLDQESRRHPGKGLRLQCAPDVAEVFRQGQVSAVLDQLTKHLPAPVEFQTESGHGGDTYEIEIIRT